MLTLLGLGGLHLILGGGGLPPGLLHGLCGLGQLAGEGGPLLVQPLQLVGPAEDARAAGHRAAGHGAAGVEHLAVQGDDLEPVAVLAGHGDGRVHVLGDDGAAQQVGEDLLVPGVELHQLVPQAHKALFLPHALIPELAGPDGAQRQEGAPPPVPALQVGDGGLAVLLGVHHDVLHGAAQGGLDGHGAPVGHVDEPRHRAVDAPELAPLGLPHHQFDRLGVALIQLFHLGEHVDAALEGVFLHLELDVALLRLPGLLLPAVQPQAVAVDHVLEGVPILPGLIQGLAGLPLLCFEGLEPLLPGGELLPHRLVPIQQLLGGGGQGGQQGLGLGRGGGLHRLLLPQLLQLGGQGAGGAGGLVGLRLAGGQLGLELLRLRRQLVQPGPPLGDLGGNGARPALLLLQLPPDAIPVLQVVLDVGFQHGDGVLQAVGVGLPLHHLEADALGLHVLVPHPGGVPLGGGVEFLHRLLGLRLLAGGVLVVRRGLDGPGPDLLQLLQPQGDLQPPQLVPQQQEAPGLLTLLAQGLHLQLQLVDLVGDAHQVLLGALQLALGLLLPVAEAGDAGGLLKDLPAVSALDGQYLVDAALADDGISLPAQAGVHEQLIDVLEPDGAAVDVVLTLAGAVVPPGDHHLALLQGKQVVGIVQHQGYLGKALLLAQGGAAEDHILHLAPPQGLGGLLPHDPADGVGDIRFSAAVGAHDGGDVLVKGQHRLVRKGLEPLDFQRSQVQKTAPRHVIFLNKILYQETGAIANPFPRKSGARQ